MTEFLIIGTIGIVTLTIVLILYLLIILFG